MKIPALLLLIPTLAFGQSRTLMVKTSDGTLAALDTNFFNANNAAINRSVPNPTPWGWVTNSDVVAGQYMPGSMIEAVFTNFCAKTNGTHAYGNGHQTCQIWDTFQMPVWYNGCWPWTCGTNLIPPLSPLPTLIRNTNCIFNKYPNCTAVSMAGSMAPAGTCNIRTLLTHRHAYNRGHGSGWEGCGSPWDRCSTNNANQGAIRTDWAGQIDYYVDTNGVVVPAVIMAETGWCNGFKAPDGSYNDYSLVIYSNDVPASVEIMPVQTLAAFWAKMPHAPCVRMFTNPTPPFAQFCLRVTALPDFETCQHGNVETLKGFGGVDCPQACGTWCGGDSGSPDMVPLPSGLVFYQGRSTSGPSAQMQWDIDRLTTNCTTTLSITNYQLTWANLSKYPDYPMRRWVGPQAPQQGVSVTNRLNDAKNTSR